MLAGNLVYEIASTIDYENLLRSAAPPDSRRRNLDNAIMDDATEWKERTDILTEYGVDVEFIWSDRPLDRAQKSFRDLRIIGIPESYASELLKKASLRLIMG